VDSSNEHQKTTPNLTPLKSTVPKIRKLSGETGKSKQQLDRSKEEEEEHLNGTLTPKPVKSNRKRLKSRTLSGRVKRNLKEM